jgi:hypothetical protein
MDGARCWPRSASRARISTARSSIAGVRYSAGIDDMGGCRSSGPERRRGLLGQPGLADPRLARAQQQAPAARPRLVQQAGRPGQLTVATDERDDRRPLLRSSHNDSVNLLSQPETASRTRVRHRLRPAAGCPGRGAVLERDAVHVPDAVAELAVEGLAAGADNVGRRAEIVGRQVDDSEAGYIDTPRRTSDGHAWPRRSAGSARALSAR